MDKFYTAESVTQGHPDKLCDLIADTILDECLRRDPLARVACEVLATKGCILVAGEITESALPLDIPSVVRGVLAKVGYDPAQFDVEVRIHRQSEDICRGINRSLEYGRGAVDEKAMLGAGDQGVMVGYACDETTEYLPLPVVLAHRITSALTEAFQRGLVQGLRPDGKAQVTVQYRDGQPVRLDTVILSAQHTAETQTERFAAELEKRVLEPALLLFQRDDATKVHINPSGRFVLGGPEADTGLTGRKLMVDSYGPFAPHGGGAFSGKDGTKVDRSGAYTARYMAKNLVAAGLAKRCQVTLVYAIGMAEPVMVEVDTFGTGRVCADDCLAAALRYVFGLRPQEMIDTLKLREAHFAETAVNGHFGHTLFAWERTDMAKALREAVM